MLNCGVNARWQSYFYRKQHEDATFVANTMIAAASERPRSFKQKDKTKLLVPLLRLRQACCHPQVGSHGVRSLKKNPMTMSELLVHLIDKAKVEAGEAQRYVFRLAGQSQAPG